MIGKTNAASGGGAGMETVIIRLVSNQGVDANLIGKKITVTYGNDKVEEHIWNGDAISIKIPAYAVYTITPENIEGYNNPTAKTITAEEKNVRNVDFNYSTEKVSLLVTVNEGTITPNVTFSGGFNKVIACTSGVTYTILIPSGVNYTVTADTIEAHTVPPAQQYTADSVSRSIQFNYTFLLEDAYAMWVLFDDTTTTTTLERGGNLAVIDSLTSKFKRCLAMPQANGHASITYLNPNNSNQFEDGSAVSGYTDFYMVHFPKYYYRSEMIATNKWKLYVSEMKIDNRYKEERECLVGVFEAYNNGGRLCSKANVASTASQTITTFFNQARANGSQWGIEDYRIHKTLANLFCAKYGNTDISNKNAAIPCSGGTRDYSANVGATLSLGNKDGLAGSSSSFLGVEDCYYGKWEFVQGINIINRQWIVYDGGLKVDTAAANLTTSGYTNVRTIGTAVASDDWIKAIAHGEYADVMPTAVGGSSTTNYADYYWWNSGNKVFLRSGVSDFGSNCGVFLANANDVSGCAYSIVGSRCGFYGTIDIVSKNTFLSLTPNYNG